MESWGPYGSKTNFLDDFTTGFESSWGQAPLSYLYEKDHAICLTHSDLSLSNLLVERGRLSGVIDWEHAGFKPEYWEYTRDLWSNMGDSVLERDYSLAYDKEYSEELEGERMLSRLKPVFLLPSNDVGRNHPWESVIRELRQWGLPPSQGSASLLL